MQGAQVLLGVAEGSGRQSQLGFARAVLCDPEATLGSRLLGACTPQMKKGGAVAACLGSHVGSTAICQSRKLGGRSWETSVHYWGSRWTRTWENAQ